MSVSFQDKSVVVLDSVAKARARRKRWIETHPEKARDSFRRGKARYRAQASNQKKIRIAARKYYEQNSDARREYSRLFRITNPDYKRRYELINRGKLAEQRKARYKKNAEKMRGLARDYRNRNRAKVCASARRYRQLNLNYRIKSILCSRMLQALRSRAVWKSKRTLTLTGCDLEFLMSYLQSRFKTGMTWQNHGRGPGKWHIDHRIPCAAFDLSQPDQQRQCFHYSNLQPLWSEDNASKHATLPPPHQAELL